MLRVLRIAGLVVLAVLLVVAALVWGTAPSAGTGEFLVPAKTSFTKDRFFAYASPWGGEMFAPTRRWSRFADAIVVDLNRFPANSRFTWRWPPFLPQNGAGVWGYDWIGYGNYDGSETEKPVAPVRVRDLKALRQTFRWSLANRFGDGDVLTEFYLHPTATNVAVKRIEIGWFLHAPANIRRFFDGSRLIGSYVDEGGRRWTVRMGGQYCMFAPEQPGDVPSGSIDMLRALRWLKSQGVITGEEWFYGLAIGVEPVRGFGRFELHTWQVAMN